MFDKDNAGSNQAERPNHLSVVHRTRAAREADTRATLLPEAGHAQLAALYKAFARVLSQTLSVQLQATVSVTAGRSDEATLSEVCESRGECTYLLVFAEPSDRPILIGLDNGLAIRLLELTLGGSPESAAVSRQLTDLEAHLLLDALMPVAECLGTAFSREEGLRFRVDSIHSDPKAARAFPPAELLVSVELLVDSGGQSGRMEVLHPVDIARQLSGSSVDTFDKPPETAGPPLSFALLQQARIKLDVHVPPLPVSVSDLVQLQPGQVLKLDRRLSDLVDCTVNGSRRFTGRIARSGSRRAFVIDTVLD